MAEKESEKKPVAAKKAAKPKTEAKETKTVKAEAKKADTSKKEAPKSKPKAAAKPKAKTTGEISVTLKKSGIGKAKDQKATIRGLGFKRLNQTVTLKDTPSVRGMINKISHLVEVQ
jgi:large subunit ribosomal protein L30